MPQKRIHLNSSSPWEEKVGYSRVVRVGNIVEVAGTTAKDGEVTIGRGDGYAQARFIFTRIEGFLKDVGATLNDVVRTRMYVTDASLWSDYAKAHKEVFGEINPVSTLVEVSNLIDETLMIEVEVTAILSE